VAGVAALPPVSRLQVVVHHSISQSIIIAATICFVLDDDNYTQNEMEDLIEGVLHLYATHQQKNAYNEEMLRRTGTEDNPLAVIECKDETSSNNNKFMFRHLHNTYDMRKTMLCRAAMVELSKTNVMPKWGLYNGALGTIIDIIV
jgi:hypothetical protein